jgi:hypothetical protein
MRQAEEIDDHWWLTTTYSYTILKHSCPPLPEQQLPSASSWSGPGSIMARYDEEKQLYWCQWCGDLSSRMISDIGLLAGAHKIKSPWIEGGDPDFRR